MAKLIVIREKKEFVPELDRKIIAIKQKVILTQGREDVHTKYGVVKKEDMNEGKHKTSTGKDFFVVPAGFIDVFKHLKKLPQTIPTKDIALILAETGMNRDTKVLDSGLGSGALALSMANICKEVIAYEIRDDCIDVARENMSALGIKNIVIKNKNIYDDCDETGMDVVTLDLPEPWRAIDSAEKALKVGGWLVSYSPSTTQVQQFCNALAEKETFIITKTIEILERLWKVEGQIVRPKIIDIGHSGFMTFARKL